jgi:three-Cys-motif partner protein
MSESEQLSIFNQSNEPNDSVDFFKKKRLWSASKHRIMLKYIQSFCYNLGGKQPYQSKILNYIDGFAGKGKYDEGIGIKEFIDNSNFWKKHKNFFSDTDGSPLIALKCANLFQEEDRVNLRCFFSEANKKINRTLRENCQNIENINKNLEYKIYEPQSFSKSFSSIMEDIEKYPSLFFLDAFAVKGLNFLEITQICDYLNKYKGELFLLFNNRAVARHAGQFTVKSNSDRTIKAAETYTQNLTDLLGNDSWKDEWQQLKNYPLQFENWALNYFKNQLLYRSLIKGVTSFEVKESYDDTRPQYSIVVCSNHPQKAFGEFLNDFIAEENKLLFHKETNENIENFLDAEWNRDILQKRRNVKNRVIEILAQKGSKSIILDDAITHLILKYDELGYLKRKQYREIMIELYHEGKFSAENLGNKNQLTLKSKIKVV